MVTFWFSSYILNGINQEDRESGWPAKRLSVRGKPKVREGQGTAGVGRWWENSRRGKWRLKELCGRGKECGACNVRGQEAERLRKLTGRGGKDRAARGASCEGKAAC